MGRRKKTNFSESLANNMNSYYTYVTRLKELSVAMWKYKNLPDTVDSRYIELALFENGNVVYFNDSVMGNLCLSCAIHSGFDVYGYPKQVRAYSRYNNYQIELNRENSVVIFNNYLRTNSVNMVYYYAKRLWDLDRIIDINANAQKTPVLIQGKESEKLSLTNLYKEYDGNSPVIYAYDKLDVKGLTVLKTDAPYVADKLYDLKNQIWNEALTYIGISNINIQKKERMITDEVIRNQGGTIASRYSRLESRQQGFDKVNSMFGTNIGVEFREDLEPMNLSVPGIIVKNEVEDE